MDGKGIFMAMHLHVYIPADLNLYHASKLFSGMGGLAASNEVRVRFSCKNPWQLDDLTVGMELSYEEGTRKIAFDLRDRSDLFCTSALEECDVYWKRSFVTGEVAALKSDWQAKVRPFGLNFSCRGMGSTLFVLRAQLSCLIRGGLPLSRASVANWMAKPTDLRKFLLTPPVQDFFQEPTAPLDPAVIFQTRVWEPHEVYPDDPAEVNETRAQLVRVLRKRLGTRFVGGLVPTRFARENYPDVLTDLSTHRNRYIALSKRTLIGVYSRGLHHSVAHKLAEYLAASQAIVSDTIQHELPVPLQAGTHLLRYHDAEQCAENCALLLADPGRVRSMRQANHQYYVNQVEPTAHLRKCLRQSLDTRRVTHQKFALPSVKQEIHAA